MPGWIDYRSLNAKVPTASARQLATLTAKKLKKTRNVKSKTLVIRRIYRKTNDSFKLVFVALRYGSLTDFSKPL